MDKRELADKYLTQVMNDYEGLLPSSVGTMALALIYACEDLRQEQTILRIVLREFIETDAGKALGTFRQALNEVYAGPTREDAPSRPEREGWANAPDDPLYPERDTAPQASGMAMAGPLGDEYPEEPPSPIRCPSCDGRASYLTGFSKTKPAVIVCHEDNCGYRETR